MGDEGAVERLVQKAKSGESLEEDFRELCERYYAPVYRLFVRFHFSDEVSRELTQETFLRVYKGIDRFGGELRLKTWIYQIARNIALNEIRSQKTQRRDGSEIPLGDETQPDSLGLSNGGESPLEEALVSERKKLLGEALSELPPQMRRCVELRIREDLKYREIAQILGLSIETVKAHLFQARQRLRERLSGYFSDLDIL